MIEEKNGDMCADNCAVNIQAQNKYCQEHYCGAVVRVCHNTSKAKLEMYIADALHTTPHIKDILLIHIMIRTAYKKRNIMYPNRRTIS